MSPSGASLARGTVVGGRYRLEDRLGSGATATVWQAVDVVLDRPVAVKMLWMDVDDELRARFAREGQILAALEHPNLVRVLDAGADGADGADGGVPYIVMELIDGRPLDVVLASGSLPVDHAVGLVRDIAAGLAHAHKAGVVHRDVKPANIILTADGVPRVVDFGIARSESATTMTQDNTVLGTATYLAPEQALGQRVDGRADVYSTGCVLYEMLTGQPPFTGDSSVAVLYRHVHEPPARPTSLRADIPRDLETVVLRALAKDPAQRPDSDRLAADLGAVRDGGATSPARTAVLPPVGRTRPARRGWLLATVVVVALFAALLVAAVARGPSTVTMADVRGEPFDDAKALLEERELQVARVDRADPASPGVVIAQDQPPGTDLPPGALVELTVSSGPPPEEPDNDKDDDKEEEEDKDDDDKDDDDKDDDDNGKRGRGRDKG